MDQSILESMIQLFSEILDYPVSKINKDSSSDTIKNWDSLQNINLVIAVENKFKIKFKIEEIEDLNKIEDFSILVEKKINDKK